MDDVTQKILKQAEVLETQLEGGTVKLPDLLSFFKNLKSTIARNQTRASKKKVHMRKLRNEYLQSL